MKKLTLSITLLFSILLSAQISVSKHDGTPITNGDIITFTQATDPQSLLEFYVHNNTSAPILTKIQFVSATNYDGTNFQLCYGTDCIDNIVVGQSYPNTAFQIPANGQNGNFDHFLNTNTGNGVNYPMDFVFKFYTLNNFGSEIGTPITFTYRFDPTLSTSNFTDIKNIGVEVTNTLVDDHLELTTTKNISLDLFDTSGKKVYSEDLTSGNKSIDLSNLSSNVYILNITNEENQQGSIKIIKK